MDKTTNHELKVRRSTTLNELKQELDALIQKGVSGDSKVSVAAPTSLGIQSQKIIITEICNDDPEETQE